MNWRRKISKFVDGCFEIIDRSRPLQTWSLSAKWMFKMITLFHSVICYWETRHYKHQHDFCSYCRRIWGIFYSYDWNCWNICSSFSLFKKGRPDLLVFSYVYILFYLKEKGLFENILMMNMIFSKVSVFEKYQNFHQPKLSY